MTGVRTATFVSPPFRVLAQKRRESLGMPDLSLVWVVHPMMNLSAAEIEVLADNILPDVVKLVAALAAPGLGEPT